MKLNVKELLDFFDNKKDDIRHDISSVIGVVGEDLGAALFKRYYEETFGKKVIISPFPVVSGTMKGPRLDRWIYIEQSKDKFVAYQTEIKNWSAYAIGARKVGIDPKDIPSVGLLNWQDRIERLQHKDKNGENKVFYPMKKPIDFPADTNPESLMIYWYVLSKDGRNLNPFFQLNMNVNGNTRKLSVFSMSNYLRSIKSENINLDMPSAEKRIRLLSKHFPIK